MTYDIAVIGNDEAAFEMLNLAAGSGLKCVALLPQVRHSSWLVSQALRRLVSDLLVDRTRQRRHIFARVGRPALLKSLLLRSVAAEMEEHIQMLETIGVDVVMGEASVAGKPSGNGLLQINCEARSIDARFVAVCTGVRRAAMHQAGGVNRFHDPTWLLSGRRMPKSVAVIGGGEFGAGLAALTSLFGVDTRLVARQDKSSVMLELAASAGVQSGQHPADVGLNSRLDSVDAEDVVDCRRSIGFTEHLNLNALSVEPDENGQLWCAGNLETWYPGVFGAGSVVGFSPDSTLQSTIQAERIMSRILHKTPRPHMLREFTRVSA